nr:MAG TPA: hypothetical protein [Caudoviricetes sp.]
MECTYVKKENTCHRFGMQPSWAAELKNKKLKEK